jgi:hypothetical protein
MPEHGIFMKKLIKKCKNHSYISSFIWGNIWSEFGIVGTWNGNMQSLAWGKVGCEFARWMGNKLMIRASCLGDTVADSSVSKVILLWTEQFRVLFPVGRGRFFFFHSQNDQTSSGAHLVTCFMDTGGYCPGVKQGGMNFTSLSHVLPRLRISGTAGTAPVLSLYAFIAS